MKIAVDAMGGDHAPAALVEGAVQAAAAYGVSIVLVGQEDLIYQELAKYDIAQLEIEVKHASQVVEMHDLPSVALRRKKDSSLHVAINLVPQGYVDAAVSAGNTGAIMAISKLACRTLPGIDRPALATVMPNVNGATVIIDVGANVDCKPIHLLQFAVMGHVYTQEVLGIENPRIGLLSTGEEASKGNVLTKEVFEPLSKTSLNFIGNVEGRDVFNDRVDVIVCDGFTGNVVLKVSESLAETIGLILKEGFTQNWRTKLGYWLAKSALVNLKKRTDAAEYGGAPLLGLNGVAIKTHGSSKAKAVKNAIRVAGESVNHHIQEKIVDLLESCEFDVKARKRATSLWHQLKVSIRHESEKGKPLLDKSEAVEPKEPSLEKDPLSEPEPLHEAGQEPEKPHEPEREKRAWWYLKDLTHREKDKSENQEESELPELPIEPVFVTEPEQPQELVAEMEKSPETDHKRRMWWSLKSSKQREKNKLNDQEGNEFKESIPEPEPRVEPESNPDGEQEPRSRSGGV